MDPVYHSNSLAANTHLDVNQKTLHISGQDQNEVNFVFLIKLDLECQDKLSHKNSDLNQGLLHIWSKFGDPGLNGWWVIAQTISWLTHT